jgi:transcriptional regulator with XRE-family HTH domain
MDLVGEKMAKQNKDSESNAIAEDPEDIVRIVARRLQEARIRAGLTQSQLGEKLGIRQSYIFELEVGDTNPTLKTLEKWATALGSDLRDLIPGAPGAPPSGSDIGHILVTLDRLTVILEDYIHNERQRVLREEQRRAKNDVVLLEALRTITLLRADLRPLCDKETASNESISDKKEG